MKPFLILFTVSVMLCQSAESQHIYGFEPYEDVPVLTAPDDTLRFPWTGGLNAVQFNTMDLNDDGREDLICFDRIGNRMLTFLNENNQWKYSPEHQKLFPIINHWIMLRDYNFDGKKDLFTYTTGGIKVFRNDGETIPVFTQITDPFLTSLQGNIHTNILVTYADYPGIIDIDHDGDLDILTFWGLGSFVEMHKNMSMELYGNADSLVFEKVTYCWGYFAESEESNELFLDTCVNIGNPPGAAKHTGSTFLLFDYDYDNDYDLLLGDVDYPTMAMLENGGDDQQAYMISQTLKYPPSDPINLFSFPAAYLEDVDFDGLKDLLVAPFDPSPDHSAVSDNILFYKNYGDYNFQLVQKDFLQNEMIDLGAGAYPCFYDWNGDGLMDMIVGNEGVKDTCFMDDYYTLHCKYRSFLSLYMNIGTTTEPVFLLTDSDLGGLGESKIYGLNPAIGDIDNDGDVDIVCGTEEGSFIWLENIGINNSPEWETHFDAFDGISTDHNSAPALIDIDDDGDIDIVSGARDGFLHLFENVSTGNMMMFSLTDDSFGDVDVRDLNVSYYGYSTPCFFQPENGDLQLFVGSGSGRIHLYDNITGNMGGSFNCVSNNLHYLDPGDRSACSLTNINGDDYPDLVIGNYSGGLTLYKGIWPPSGSSEFSSAETFSIFPNPAKEIITIRVANENSCGGIVVIYSSDGSKIKETTVNNIESKVNISELIPGVYYLSLIIKNNNIGYRKFIKSE